MDAADNLGVAANYRRNNFRARLLQLYLPAELFTGAVARQAEENFRDTDVAARRAWDCARVVDDFSRADF